MLQGQVRTAWEPSVKFQPGPGRRKVWAGPRRQTLKAPQVEPCPLQAGTGTKLGSGDQGGQLLTVQDEVPAPDLLKEERAPRICDPRLYLSWSNTRAGPSQDKKATQGSKV